MRKDRIRIQFGSNAEAYGTSQIHASGSSLFRLVELVEPQPNWSVLDIATGAGHTAHAFSRNVDRVIAVDITPEMLSVAKRISAEKSYVNLDYAVSDALELPFPDRFFDVVTCRLAAHHLSDISGFLLEVRRVVVQGGFLALVDNVVPGSLRRGKKSKAMNRAGQYINSFDRLRDPSHVRSLSIEEWQVNLLETGFRICHQESERKTIDFYRWAHRMAVPMDNIYRLRAMLRHAPQPVYDFMRPKLTGSNVQFDLIEAIFVAQKDFFSNLDPPTSGR